MINWKVRFKNPVFIAQLVLSIFAPILAYLGLTAQDLTSWKALLDVITCAFTNPYVLLLVIASFWNALNDPTTSGVYDSTAALTYSSPKKD